jgi:hypothetical protein
MHGGAICSRPKPPLQQNAAFIGQPTKHGFGSQQNMAPNAHWRIDHQ